MSPQVTAAILIFIFLQNDMIISRNISSKLPNLLLMMLRLLGIVVGVADNKLHARFLLSSFMTLTYFTIILGRKGCLNERKVYTEVYFHMDALKDQMDGEKA